MPLIDEFAYWSDMSMMFHRNKDRLFPSKNHKTSAAIATVPLLILMLSALPARSQNVSQAELLENKAMESLQNYQLNSAIDYMEQARQAALNTPDIEAATTAIIQIRLAQLYSLRGATFFSSGWPENAIKDFTRAIEVDIVKPGNADIQAYFPYETAYIMRGMSYAMTSRYDDSIADFDSAKRANDLPEKDKWVSFHAIRGYTYFYKGDMLQSEIELQTALKLYPDDPLGHCLDTDLATASGDAQKTLVSIKDHYEMCNKNNEHGNDEIETLRRYILKNNALPTAQEFCAGAEKAFQENNSQKAVDLYYICFTLEPKNAKVSYNLALAYALDGDIMKARHFFYRSLYLVPEAPDKMDILKMIDDLNPDESVDDTFRRLHEIQNNEGAGGEEK